MAEVMWVCNACGAKEDPIAAEMTIGIHRCTKVVELTPAQNDLVRAIEHRTSKINNLQDTVDRQTQQIRTTSRSRTKYQNLIRRWKKQNEKAVTKLDKLFVEGGSDEG